MNLFAIHAGGVKALQDALGDDCPTLFINGQLIKILPGGVKLKRENTSGGFSLDTDIQLTCLSADFKSQPQSRQTFTYPGEQGTRFNIVSVTVMPGGLQLRINGDG
jgi:hypothetical protein